MRQLSAVAVCGALVLLAAQSKAAPGQVSLSVSSKRPQLGETFTVQLVALTDRGSPLPSAPKLRGPAGIVARGPDISAQTRVNIVGGKVIAKIGIAATWALRGTKLGSFTIGPGSVVIDGKQVLSRAVRVIVVPAQPRATRQPFDPFDPFSFPGMPKLPGMGASDDEEDEEDEIALLPPYPGEYRLERAADPTAFLRAEVEPRRAVVGEQVTLSIYAYGQRGPFRETHTSEPSREAFLSFTLLENSYAEPMYRVPVGDSVWHAKKVRQLALFPIRAGKLVIGAMRLGFDGRGYPSDGPHRGLVRYSNPIELPVDEPPVAGRPPGYKLGDVGRYTLSASVTPREISAGEAVSVVAKLEGTGNVPFSLKVPRKTAVEWLEPNIIEQVEPRGSTIGGFRRFSYIVRIDAPGDIDLGELSVPFWDPERGRYETARATLGRVTVRAGGANGASPEPPPRDPLTALGPPRKSLGNAEASATSFSRQPWFFPSLLLSPLLVVGAYGGRRLVQTARQRAKSAAEDPTKLARSMLAQARQAQKQKDIATVATKAESAIMWGIEYATGLRARAVLKEQLPAELATLGLDADTIALIQEVLTACDDVRFAEPLAGDELYERARALTERLLKLSPRGDKRAS